MDTPCIEKEALSVAILQDSIIPYDCESNLRHWDAIMSQESLCDVDVVLLPEFFTSGFIVDSVAHAQTMDGSIVHWMRKKAADLGALLCGTAAIRVDDRVYNRLLAVYPTGEVMHYDKRHLFFYGGEAECFSPGAERLVLSYLGWRILPLICYDLRFPLWSYNISASLDYDLLIYLANFPTARIDAWDILLRARAVENQCFVAACNRLGCDHTGLEHAGHSVIINPFGKALTDVGFEGAGVISAVCHRSVMRRFRAKYPFLLDGAADLPLIVE